MKSNTEALDPNWALPKIDTALPHLENDLIDKELPRCKKSKTEADDPKRAIPNTDTALPHRPYDRIDIVLPN